MTWTLLDYQFMSRAIKLAARGRYTCHPNPRVGCVITRDGNVIGEGWHIRAGEAHAEVNAIQDAGDISGSRIYLTLEPCSHHGRTPPCVEVLIEAGIKETVVAMTDPNPRVAGEGIEKLKAAGIEVYQGLLEDEARKLNPGFCKRMEEGLPFVRCKLAMSVDGKTALANGVSQWISSAASRRDVHKLRALSSAIVTSIETVLADDPSLTVRDMDVDHGQPLRVILDRQMKTPPAARLLGQAGQTVIYTMKTETPDWQHDNVDIISLPESDNWLLDVFRHMARHYEINEVMIEAGGKLAAAILKAGLIDELVIYMAPMLLGSDARPLIELTGTTKLEDKVSLSLQDIRHLGEDIRLTYTTRH